MSNCKECGEELVESKNWPPSRKRKKYYICNKCSYALILARRASDTEYDRKYSDYHNEYRKKPEVKKKKYQQELEWKAKNTQISKERQKDRSLKSRYGISLEEYRLLFESQGESCAICGTKVLEGKGAFHLDHDHSTGKVRGILCSKCNHALGLFKDDQRTLLKAIEYLGGTCESNSD